MKVEELFLAANGLIGKRIKPFNNVLSKNV